MRVAVLGAGRIGALHAGLLSEHPDVEPVLVADADIARAQAVATTTGGQALATDEILAAGIDAAVITAATEAHRVLIEACLDGGIPTFCEKPLARTYEETVLVTERAGRDGAVLQVGFNRRFDAGYRAAKQTIDSGAIGTIYSMKMASLDPRPPHEEYLPVSGTCFRDMHIHDWDILRWLTGQEVAQIYARGAVMVHEMFARYDDFDSSSALVTMESGMPVVVLGSRQNAYGYDVRTEVFGTGDSISVGLDRRTPLRSVEPGSEDLIGPSSTPEQPWPDFQTRFEPAYRAELSHFLDLARGRAENPCTARDALEALRIAIAAERSVRENRPVRLDEVPR